MVRLISTMEPTIDPHDQGVDGARALDPNLSVQSELDFTYPKNDFWIGGDHWTLFRTMDRGKEKREGFSYLPLIPPIIPGPL